MLFVCSFFRTNIKGVRQLNDVSKQNNYKGGCCGLKLRWKRSIPISPLVFVRKNKRLGIKIKHACVRSDVVFTKISASFLYKVWMIFWCSSSLPPQKTFPIERNVIKYEKIVGFLFRLIKTHCYQRKLELEWWSWLYFLNNFLSFGIPPCKNKIKRIKLRGYQLAKKVSSY